MLGWFLVGVAILALTVCIVSPKLGAMLALPILFVYPHMYMVRLGLLPWNIGIDDLFICVLFLVVAVRSNFLGQTPLRMSFSLIGVLTLAALLVVANLSGWSRVPSEMPIVILKPILKGFVFVLFVYCMVHTINTERDLRQMSLVYVLTMTAAAFTVILYRFFPAQLVLFASSEDVERAQQWWGIAPRSVGSLESANTGCALLAMAVLFCLVCTRLPARIWVKSVLLGCIPVLLAAMVLTQSRSGGLALAATLALMCVASRSRLWSGALVFGIICAMVLRSDLFWEYRERVLDVYNPAVGGQWGGNAAARFEVWEAYILGLDAQTLLLGQGRVVGMIRYGLHTHSTYVSVIALMGLGGVIWALAFFTTFGRRAWATVRMGVQPYSTYASAVAWSMVAWAVAGLTLDMLLTFLPQYTMLFYAVVVERSHDLSRQARAVPALSLASAGWASRLYAVGGAPGRRPGLVS